MKSTIIRSSRTLALLLSVCAWACSDGSNADGTENTDSMGDPTDGTMDDASNAGGGMTGGMEPEGNGTAFSERGVCGARATGVVTAQDFQVKEERYLLSDDGFGPAICVVSFDVRRLGDAPPGCDENAGQQDECRWTHLVQYENPTVVLDENGVCANSELGMDADAIAAIDGVQLAYGYVFEYQGHNSVLMIYSDEQDTWEPGHNAGWDGMTGDFFFDERRGACRYAPGPAMP